MCFSATASFLTAGMTGAIGVMTLRRAKRPNELPLASIPALFAIQQAAEGGLWLVLPDGAGSQAAFLLTQLFLLFALVVWPIFAPLAALALEPVAPRRNIMKLCVLAGVGVSSYFAMQMWISPQVATISGHHILYQTGVASPLAAGGVYLAATTLALMVSSHRAVAALGMIVFAGSLIAHVFYYEVFVSVWCFFAAASSFVILAHFEVRERLTRPAA